MSILSSTILERIVHHGLHGLHGLRGLKRVAAFSVSVASASSVVNLFFSRGTVLMRALRSLSLISLFAASARAQLLYVTNADRTSITITGYTNTAPAVLVIPTTINGLTVNAIGDDAFENEYGIESATIPPSIANIGDFAFSGCGLTNLVIPYGVTDIGMAAFGDCYSLTDALIPDTVTTIGPGGFIGSGLTSVTIPANVTNFGGGAFDDCGDLTNVVISFGISSLQADVFAACYSLPSVVIPSSVTNITDYAFEGCPALTQVFFMGNAPAVDNTAFQNIASSGFGGDTLYYAVTAYYLSGTTGWAEFSSNTVITPSYSGLTTNVFVPAVLWNPTIQASGTNFGIQNGQYGFDVVATNNLPIAIEACDDVAQSSWVVLKRLTLTNGLFHFSEPFQSNNVARFYRIGFP